MVLEHGSTLRLDELNVLVMLTCELYVMKSM